MSNKTPRSPDVTDPGSTSDYAVPPSFVPPPEAPESRFFFYENATSRPSEAETEHGGGPDQEDETRADEDELAVALADTIEFTVPDGPPELQPRGEAGTNGAAVPGASAGAGSESGDTVPDTGEFASEGGKGAKADTDSDASTLEFEARFASMMQDSGDELRPFDSNSNRVVDSPQAAPASRNPNQDGRGLAEPIPAASPVISSAKPPSSDSGDGFPFLAYADETRAESRAKSDSNDGAAPFAMTDLIANDGASSSVSWIERRDDDDEPEGWRSKAERWLMIGLGYYAITITFVAIYLWWTRPSVKDPNPTTEEINKQLDRENQSFLRRVPPSSA